MAHTSSVLVTGCTGFLAPVTVYLINQGHFVYAIGRDPDRFKALRFILGDKAHLLHTIHCDYTDPEALEYAMGQFREFPDMSVHWLHSKFKSGAFKIAKLLNKFDKPHRFVHVLNSSAAAPGADPDHWRNRLQYLQMIHYQRVILGFKMEEKGSRWLTHPEIVKGVIHTLENPDEDHTVGQLEPWYMRP